MLLFLTLSQVVTFEALAPWATESKLFDQAGERKSKTMPADTRDLFRECQTIHLAKARAWDQRYMNDFREMAQRLSRCIERLKKRSTGGIINHQHQPAFAPGIGQSHDDRP